MHKSAVPASEKRMKAEPRSTRHASSIHATLSNHPIEAFCLSPSCINKVTYAIGQPGRKALFCSQNCAAEYTGNRRRLRNEVAELNRKLASMRSATQERRDLEARLKHVQWHLARYGG